MNKKNKDKKRRKAKTPQKILSTRQYIFFGFLIVILPLINLKEAQDRVLMPQLLAVSVFLFFFSLIVIYLFKKPVFCRSWFKNPVLIAIVGYLLLTVFSSFVAVNFKESLFDIVKTFIFLIIILFALYQFEQKTERIIYIPDFFLISGIILLGIGYYQYFTLVLPSTEKFLPDGRSIVYLVNGMMAHKNLYSSAIFMLLPFLAWSFWINKSPKKFLYAFVVVASLVMILLLSTRAVWLGILIAGFSMVSVLIIKSKQFNLSHKFRIYSMITIIALIAGGVVFVAGKQSASSFSIADRFRSIFDPEASNNRYRLNVWSASLEIWEDNPIIGVGAGNWKTIAPAYFNDFGFDKQQLNWFRPHNDFLWVLTEKGMAGLIFYLLIFIASLYYIFKTINQSENKDFKVLSLLLGGGLTGYLTISFFDFPLERIFHQTLLAVWLAIIITVVPQKKEDKTATKQNQFNVAVIFSVILFFSVIYSYSATKLEVVVKKVQIAKERANWQEMYAFAQTIPTRFRNVDAEATPVHYYHGLAKEQMKQYDSAINYYLQALEEHPAKVQVMNNLGLMYYNTGNLILAREYLENALDILPNYFEALVNMSAVCTKEGNYRESLEYLYKIPNSRWDERFYMKERQLKRIIENNVK